MVEGASCFNTGPKCDGAKCTHRDHQIGADPVELFDISTENGFERWAEATLIADGYEFSGGPGICVHSIAIEAECSRCTRQQREVHR